MKKSIIIAAALLMACACGSLKNTPSSLMPTDVRNFETRDRYVFISDDPALSKKTADAFFDTYADMVHITKTVTYKRLVSIRPEQTAITITYDFRTVDGGVHRVKLRTENFIVVRRSQYKKDKDNLYGDAGMVSIRRYGAQARPRRAAFINTHRHPKD